MNIQERIEALETEFAEKIKALKAEVQQEQEFPKIGDFYWHTNARGEIFADRWDGLDFEKYKLAFGNVYQTKQDAEFALEKLKVEAELRKLSRPFENGKFNHYIFFYIDDDCIEVSYKRSTHSQGTIYFESEEKAQQAIETVGTERIKKYIFGVEDKYEN